MNISYHIRSHDNIYMRCGTSGYFRSITVYGIEPLI